MRTKLCLLFLAAFAALSMNARPLALEPCPPAEGDGSQLQPYKITQACELLWYAENVQTKDLYAILDADISLGNTHWTPIGSKQTPYKAHFDGRNHYITDYVVEADTAGLFGYTQGATIENIKVRNASVTGKKYTGIICGYAASTNIIACDNYAVVMGETYTGGICGYLDNAKISNCLNEGEVKATGDFVGGVAGFLNSAEVRNCVNRKSVSSDGDYVGGVAGSIAGRKSTITSCSSSAQATVRGKSYVGGLCGNVQDGSVMTSSSNEGAVYGTGQETGGVIGSFKGSTAEKLTNYGYVESSSTQVGGVIGSSKNISTVKSCANTGTIVAVHDRNVGGLIGNAASTVIAGCLNIGLVKGKNYTAGLVGYLYEDSQMQCCANYGSVLGENYVGGLTGESRAVMEKSFSTGAVKGTGNYVGGISGNLFQSQYSKFCLYDNQMCPLDKAFGAGTGDGEGVPTSELIGYVSTLSGGNYSFTMDNNGYPRPASLADETFTAAGASAIVFAEGDNVENFSQSANLTVVNKAKWSSKGGTKINGTTAEPNVKGQDTLYVTKASCVKVIPVIVTTSSSSVKTYTVTFKDWDGNVLKVEQVEEGHSATAPANPTRDGYTFTGWDKDFSNVTSDMTVTAQYTQDKPSVTYYTVTFKDWDGKVLKREQVEEGHSATAPANPTRDGYTFIGWDKDFSNVHSNLIVTAQYQINSTPSERITVRLKASSASGWSKVNLYYWGDGVSSPAWPGIAVSKDAEGWYSHTFDASVRSVNIIWNDGNNQTTDITNVTESTCYSLKSTSGKTIGVNVVDCQSSTSVSVTGVQLNKKTLQLTVGGSEVLKATILPSNASNTAVTWTSSNTMSVSVSSSGKVSAIEEGISTITCETQDGHYKAECYVVVSEANSEYDYSFEPSNATTIRFEASQLLYEDMPDYGCVFVSLINQSYYLALQYIGSLVNGRIPGGNYEVSSLGNKGTFFYSVGGDASADYGSFLAADFDSNGSYSSAYYIIAGEVTFDNNGGCQTKLISANGTYIEAVYKQSQTVKTYTITFVDWDGGMLKTEQVEEGSIPQYSGATPTRPEDEQYTYTFIGWTPEIVAATADATYTATYKAKDKHEGIEDIHVDATTPRKMMIDGVVYILRGDKIYTVQGQEVR